MDRERVLRETWSRRNVGGHLASDLQLSIGCLRQERDDKVLQCDYAYTKLHQLSVRQFGDVVAVRAPFLGTSRSSAAFTVPTRKGGLPLLGTRKMSFVFGHGTPGLPLPIVYHSCLCRIRADPSRKEATPSALGNMRFHDRTPAG